MGVAILVSDVDVFLKGKVYTELVNSHKVFALLFPFEKTKVWKRAIVVGEYKPVFVEFFVKLVFGLEDSLDDGLGLFLGVFDENIFLDEVHHGGIIIGLNFINFFPNFSLDFFHAWDIDSSGLVGSGLAFGKFSTKVVDHLVPMDLITSYLIYKRLK